MGARKSGGDWAKVSSMAAQEASYMPRMFQTRSLGLDPHG